MKGNKKQNNINSSSNLHNPHASNASVEKSTYNREAAKLALEKYLMENIKVFFNETTSNVNDKNDERSKVNEHQGSGNQALTQMREMESQARQLLTIIKNTKHLTNVKKAVYYKIAEATKEVISQFIEKKKCFPVKACISLYNIVTDTHNTVRAITQYTESRVFSACCSSEKLNKQIQLNFDKLEKLNYFWEKLLTLEAREGYQEIHHAPILNEGKLRSNLSHILEEYIPHEPAPQQIIVHQPQQQVVQRPQKEEDHLRMAHELLFGFSRAQNVEEALVIYNQEANNYNIQALNSLGQIYSEGKVLPLNMRKALQYYEQSASRNDPEGWFRLGIIMMSDLSHTEHVVLVQQHLQQNPDYLSSFQQSTGNNEVFLQLRRALYCYGQSAEYNHSEALYELGKFYEKGYYDINKRVVIEKDTEKAQQYYIGAKKQRNFKAINNLGMSYLQMQLENPQQSKVKGEYLLKAINNFELASQLGYDKAFYNLGMCYERGLGVTRSMDRAIGYYDQAAQKGNTDAQFAKAMFIIQRTSNNYNDMNTEFIQCYELLKEILRKEKNRDAYFYLGFLYEYGLGVSQDPKLALHQYKQSAELGSLDAQNKVGDFIFSGIGIELPDVLQALEVYSAASDQGCTEATVNIGAIYEEGSLPYIQQSYSKAFEYYSLAAENGDSKGYLNLGLMYQAGKYVRQDSDLAVENFKKAASLGNNQAQDFLIMQGVNCDHVFNLSKNTGQMNTIDQQEQLVNHELKHYLAKQTQQDSVLQFQNSIFNQQQANQLNIKLLKK